MSSPFAGVPREDLLAMLTEFRGSCPSGDPYTLPGRSPEFPEYWHYNRLVEELDQVTSDEGPRLRAITTSPDWSQFKLMAANYKTLKATACVHYCGLDFVGEQVTLTANNKDGSRHERNARLDHLTKVACAESVYRDVLRSAADPMLESSERMAAETLQGIIGPTGIVARQVGEDMVWEYSIRVAPMGKSVGWAVWSRTQSGVWAPLMFESGVWAPFMFEPVPLTEYGNLCNQLTRHLVAQAEHGWRLEPIAAEIQNAVTGAIKELPKKEPPKPKKKTTTSAGAFENVTTEAKRKITLDADFESSADEWAREEQFAITPAGTKNLGLAPTWRNILCVAIETIEEHPDKRWSVFLVPSGHRIVRNQATMRDAQVAAIRLSKLADFTAPPHEIRSASNKLLHPLCQQINKGGPYVPGPDFE